MIVGTISALVLLGAQVIGEPPGKTGVEIIHHGDGVGEQLAYLVRDQFRGSSSFLVTGDDPSYRLHITSIDSSPATTGASLSFSVVLTASQTGDGFGYSEGYITSAVYLCPVQQLSECARDAYVGAATQLELANKEFRDAANAYIDRMVEEVRTR